MNFDIVFAAARQRIYAAIEARADHAHKTLNDLASYHRRSLAARFRTDRISAQRRNG